jgi:Neuraminidase (sialidase)
MEVEWNGEGEGDGDAKEGEGEDDTSGQDGQDNEKEPKKLKSDGKLGEKDDKAGKEVTDVASNSFISMKEKVQLMNKQEFEGFLREQALEILGSAAEKIIGEVADLVVAENEERGFSEGVEEVEQALQQVEVMQTENLTSEEGAAVDGRVKIAIGSTSKEVQIAAAIKEALMVSTRSSPRLGDSSEEHTLARAERRAAAKNLELVEGNLLNNSLNSLSMSSASSILSSVGILWGATVVERNISVKSLLDYNKKCVLQSEVQEYLESDSDEDCSERLEQDAIKQLCGDLVDEVFDDDSYQCENDSWDFQSRNKFGAKSLKRKTCKVNVANLSKKVSK